MVSLHAHVSDVRLAAASSVTVFSILGCGAVRSEVTGSQPSLLWLHLAFYSVDPGAICFTVFCKCVATPEILTYDPGIRSFEYY